MDDDPLRIKKWFKKSYSVPITILFFFLFVLYPIWLSIIDWFNSVMHHGMSQADFSFIKVFSFLLLLIVANISYMVLSKSVSLSKAIQKKDAELQDIDKKFRNFMDNIPNVAIQGFDLNFNIQYWNNASETLYGFSKEEAIGNKIIDLIVPFESQDSLIDITKSARSDTKIEQFNETVFLTKSKRKIPVYSSYSYVTLPDSNKSIFVMEIDLSERKVLEEELVISRDIAEASNKAKDVFLANVSHELRTPLNSIIGFSELLVEETAGPMNDKQKKYASIVSSSGTHLLSLINNILDISKSKAGKMKLHYEKINLKSFMFEVVEFMNVSATRKGVTINLDMDPSIDTLEIDSGKLKQILYNLIGNATKFSQDNGNVSIRIFKLESNLEFEIEDDGIGIKEKDMDKLFKPFSQIEIESDKKYIGTGLGLSLVKNLVELHGGKIWVKSEYGKYSIFGFSIPIEIKENVEEDNE